MQSRHHSNGDGDSTAPGITSRMNDGNSRSTASGSGGGGAGSSGGGAGDTSSTAHLRVVGAAGEGVEQVRANAGRTRPAGTRAGSSGSLRSLGRQVTDDQLGELGGLLGRAHGTMRPPSQEEVLARLRSGVREEIEALATGQGKSADRAKLRVRTIYDWLTTSDSKWISAAKWAGIGLLLTAAAVAVWATLEALTASSSTALSTSGMAMLQVWLSL